MNKIFSVILSGSALAGMAMAFVVAAAEPVEAKRSACVAKYHGCQSRCARRYDDFIPCINRTCNPQFDHCDQIERGGGRRGLTVDAKQAAGPHTPRPSDNRGPLESGG